MAEFRVVKIEPCEPALEGCTRLCTDDDVLMNVRLTQCPGCCGDGTRMVDVAMVEQDQRVVVDEWGNTKGEPVWVEVKP